MLNSGGGRGQNVERPGHCAHNSGGHLRHNFVTNLPKDAKGICTNFGGIFDSNGEMAWSGGLADTLDKGREQPTPRTGKCFQSTGLWGKSARQNLTMVFGQIALHTSPLKATRRWAKRLLGKSATNAFSVSSLTMSKSMIVDSFFGQLFFCPSTGGTKSARIIDTFSMLLTLSKNFVILLFGPFAAFPLFRVSEAIVH